MNNFKDLKIWQKGMDICVNTFKVANKIPQEDYYTLRSQMVRDGISIPSNIAEGSSRSSKKDFARFGEIALGSSFELETQCLILERVSKTEGNEIKELLSDIQEEQKMIRGFIKSLR